MNNVEMAKIRKTLYVTKDFIKEITSLKDSNGNPYKVVLSASETFATLLSSLKHNCIRIRVNIFEDMKNIVTKEFCRNAVMRNNSAKEVSVYSLCLLHELGHCETFNKIPKNYNRTESLRQIYSYNENLKNTNLRYFCLPDEYLATQWALTWLEKKEKRKKVRKFEKKLKDIWDSNTLYF